MTEEELKALAGTVGLLMVKVEAATNVAVVKIGAAKHVKEATARLILKSAQRSPFAEPESALAVLTDSHMLSGDEMGQLINTLPQALRAALLLSQDPSLAVFWGFSAAGTKSPPQPDPGESAKEYVLRIWPKVSAFNDKTKFGMLVIALGLVSEGDIPTDQTVDGMLERRLENLENALMSATQQLAGLRLLLTKLEKLKAEKADAVAHGRPWTPPKWKELVKMVQDEASGPGGGAVP
jgi:hypothetical protein